MRNLGGIYELNFFIFILFKDLLVCFDVFIDEIIGWVILFVELY